MTLIGEEFINPKSMITPAVASAIVAVIGGAFFSLGIVLEVSLVVLSFFVGCVVFLSKEFSDPDMTKPAKWFYYILNSLIIFAMATGTHGVLDRSNTASAASVSCSQGSNTSTGTSVSCNERLNSVTTASVSFIQSAHAEEVGKNNQTLEQKRPFFWNWTKRFFAPEATSSNDNGIVVKVRDDSGLAKRLFRKLRLAVPDYRVEVKIDPSKLSREVKDVTWNLPEAYFAQNQIESTDESGDYAISIKAWSPFEVVAEIELKSGQHLRWNKFITLNPTE